MPRAGLTRERLLQEGTALIAENGYDHFSVRALAAKLGVKPASLYNHIESAADLELQIAERALAELRSRLDKRASTGSAKEQLLEIALIYRAFAKEKPDLYRLIIQIPSRRNDHLNNEGRLLLGTIREILGSTSVGQTDEALHLCRSIQSAMHGFIALEGAGFFGPRLDVDESYAYMVAALAERLERTDKSNEADC